MSDSGFASKARTIVGWSMLALGVAVFAIRLQHDGAYAVPTRGVMFGGLAALLVGGLLLWPSAPRAVRLAALVASPVVFFFAVYATMAELEEVISLYATDSAGQPIELRLWIVDRDDGEWVGMPRAKAVEHSLDGASLQMLRDGETRCVVPVLHEDRPTVKAIHALKVEKYAVARAAAVIGVYPREAPDTSVSLRFDRCSDARSGPK